MAPRPTGSDCNWSNIFKESMLVRVRGDSRAQFKRYICLHMAPPAGQSQLWRWCHWKESEHLTPTHVFRSVQTAVLLMALLSLGSVFNWDFSGKSSPVSLVEKAGQPFSGLSGPQVTRAPHGASWSRPVLCFLVATLSPSPQISPWEPVLTRLPFTKCLPSIRSCSHTEVNSLRSALI